MKNICFISILSTTLMLLSCGKRDYTCQCEGGLKGGTTIIPIKESGRQQAEKECARNNSLDGGAADGYFNCKLK